MEPGTRTPQACACDFNIFSPRDGTLEALTGAGFVVPDKLQSLPSNADKNRHYDQIAFLGAPSTGGLTPTGRAGVVDYYQSVFRTDQRDEYATLIGEPYNTTDRGQARTERGKTLYYRTYWRTHQMSDHLPMWVEVQTVGGAL